MVAFVVVVHIVGNWVEMSAKLMVFPLPCVVPYVQHHC